MTVAKAVEKPLTRQQAQSISAAALKAFSALAADLSTAEKFYRGEATREQQAAAHRAATEAQEALWEVVYGLADWQAETP